MFFGGAYGHSFAIGFGAQAEEGPVDHVVDGGFDDPAEWGTAQFTVAGGVGSFATTLTRTIANVNGLPAIVGHTYRCTIDITEYTSGTGLRLNMGGVTSPSSGGLTTVGTHIEDIVAINTSAARLVAQGATTLKVDNYSVIDLDA